MPWKKGQSGNLKGAPPGPRNNYNTRRAAIDKIVDRALTDQTLIEDLFAMEDKVKFWEIIIKMMSHSIPKPAPDVISDETPVSTLDTFKERLKGKVA